MAPAPNSVTISLTTTGPGTTSIAQSGKLTFTNNMSSSTTLNLPSCVSPQNGPVVLAAGASTQAYTVNSSANGNYTYSYSTVGVEADAISGTIDVS